MGSSGAVIRWCRFAPPPAKFLIRLRRFQDRPRPCCRSIEDPSAVGQVGNGDEEGHPTQQVEHHLNTEFPARHLEITLMQVRHPEMHRCAEGEEEQPREDASFLRPPAEVERRRCQWIKQGVRRQGTAPGESSAQGHGHSAKASRSTDKAPHFVPVGNCGFDSVNRVHGRQ